MMFCTPRLMSEEERDHEMAVAIKGEMKCGG